MRSGAKILKLKFAAPGLEELYEKEDINAIRDVFVNSVNSTHTYAPEIILDQRHEQWLSHMEEAMRMSLIFFTLLMEHQRVNKGLVMILRNNGYSVEPYGFY